MTGSGCMNPPGSTGQRIKDSRRGHGVASNKRFERAAKALLFRERHVRCSNVKRYCSHKTADDWRERQEV